MHLDRTMRSRKVRPVERLLCGMQLSDMVTLVWLGWSLRLSQRI